MFQCSLFSCLEDKEFLYEYFSTNNYLKNIYNEKKYKNNEEVRLFYNIEEKTLVCIYPPDKNKNRISICCRYEEASIIDGMEIDGVIEDLGFVSENTEESKIVTVFYKEDVYFKVIDNLIHLFVLSESKTDGEKKLVEIQEELKSIINFIRIKI